MIGLDSPIPLPIAQLKADDKLARTLFAKFGPLLAASPVSKVATVRRLIAVICNP
jgi:hypothetical protein